MSRNNGQEARVDARVISLYSKGTTDNPFAQRPHFYRSYMNYLAIDVQPASTIPEHSYWEDSPLLAAYNSAFSPKPETAQNKENGEAFRQFILAFTDIDNAGKNGYTQAEIDAFWNDNSPILFISMINVSGADKLEKISKNLRASSPGAPRKTLVYFAFDNCDLIVFHKDNRFDKYADRLFRLCFQEEGDSVVDSMTLYGFRFDASTEYPKDETFDVMLRFGAEDFSKIPDFFRKAQIWRPGYTLGRSDGAIYYQQVNLQWLADCIREFDRQDGKNLHNIDLMAIVPSNNLYLGHTAPRLLGKDRFIANVRALRETFEIKYLEAYGGSTLLCVDKVLLRWLRDSCELASDLYNNALSSDIGVCLLPQYANLFRYFISIFDHQTGDDNALVRVGDAVNNCFIAFFNGMLTLMDSMNHSDRQFVQAPSFHSTSFEMPPKLLAYFTVVTQYLVNALQDDDEHYHGFTISPRFAQELDVTALTVKDDGTDNMLSIGIGESRMYTITHTTLVIAHEISHFVGNQNRCREKRRECIIKVGIRSLLNALASRLSPEDIWQPLSEEEEALRRERFINSKIDAAVDAVYDALQEKLPKGYASHDMLYLRDVEDRLLRHLPDSISSQPHIARIVIEWVIDAFFGKTFFASNNNTGYEAVWRQRIGSQFTGELNDEARRGILWRDVLSWFYEQFRNEEKYFEKPVSQSDTEELSFGHFICYMFSETFADLQTILLFDLSFDDYVRLLIYLDGKTIRDIGPRLLAVARAMYREAGWCDEDIAKVLKEVPALKDICSLIPSEPMKSSEAYGRKSVNATLIHYLTEYLKACKWRITLFLQNRTDVTAQERLRSFYKNARSNISVCQLEKEIMTFLDDFTVFFESDIEKFFGDTARRNLS